MTAKLVNGAEFLHIPKTGGSWVRDVLGANDLIADHLLYKHADYDVNLFRLPTSARQHLRDATRIVLPKLKMGRLVKHIPDRDVKPVFRFCFVRHPLAWYESWWRYMEGISWWQFGQQNSRVHWHPNAILNGLGNSDFNQFVRNVIQARPGYVSELMFAYTKPGISFIGKTENLREDLTHVLDLMGLKYDKATLEQTPKVNVSEVAPSAVEWDLELKRTVMKLELPALLHFQYLTEQERLDLGFEFPIEPHKALRRVKESGQQESGQFNGGEAS